MDRFFAWNNNLGIGTFVSFILFKIKKEINAVGVKTNEERETIANTSCILMIEMSCKYPDFF